MDLVRAFTNKWWHVASTSCHVTSRHVIKPTVITDDAAAAGDDDDDELDGGGDGDEGDVILSLPVSNSVTCALFYCDVLCHLWHVYSVTMLSRLLCMIVSINRACHCIASTHTHTSVVNVVIRAVETSSTAVGASRILTNRRAWRLAKCKYVVKAQPELQLGLLSMVSMVDPRPGGNSQYSKWSSDNLFNHYVFHWQQHWQWVKQLKTLYYQQAGSAGE